MKPLGGSSFSIFNWTMMRVMASDQKKIREMPKTESSFRFLEADKCFDYSTNCLA
jgi:hypothetical protein